MPGQFLAETTEHLRVRRKGSNRTGFWPENLRTLPSCCVPGRHVIGHDLSDQGESCERRPAKSGRKAAHKNNSALP